MQNKEAKELLLKYTTGNCTAAELALLESWYLEYSEEKMHLHAEDLIDAKARVWDTLVLHHEVSAPKLKPWPRFAIAASLLLIFSAGLVLYKNLQYTTLKSGSVAASKIVPGGNKAVLTLADGTEISLSDAANGNLSNKSGVKITKTKDGQLVYTVNSTSLPAGAAKAELSYNTITTPRGGQYQINLPDGTKVWLNAASSLRYPTAFIGSERKVQLNGEAYFEVTHDIAMPFKVESGLQTVEVLGTHFNVSSYADDELTKTTLLEGKVRVHLGKGQKEVVLKPGEQAIASGNTLQTTQVVTDDVVAWKNNDFVFNNEELGSIMKKIARWYDVDVNCPTDMEKMVFTGNVSRSKSIQQALRIMELTELVHFKVEGRRITVMK